MTIHQTDTQLIQTTNKRINVLTRQLNALKYLNARRRARIAAKHGSDPLAGKARHISFGLDYAEPVLDMRHLHSAGATFVCRYLASHPGFHNPKDLTSSESLALGRAHIGRVVVWETTADRAAQGHLAGVQDAENAKREAAQCHMPGSRPIYFAVDFDASPGVLMTYFEGVNAVLGKNRTGVYGGYRVVKALMASGRCQWGWQTYAWSGGQWYPPAQLQQYSNDHTVAGVGVDYDRGTVRDFGQW